MESLYKYTLRIADNSLILAQRLSSWCSRGPTLEEDIALTNISLDLFGQANGFLEYASKLNGDATIDELAFKRDSKEFYNHQLVEQPNGHFGDTIVRQFLHDAFYLLFYNNLAMSQDTTFSSLAKKSLKEVQYHFRHSKTWIIRLGDGTKESNQKVQQSINHFWMFIDEMFYMDDIDNDALSFGAGVNNAGLKQKWIKIVNQVFNEAKLQKPKDKEIGYKKGSHTEHLEKILEEMQYLPRAYPDAKW